MAIALGLDLATNVGYAVGDSRGAPELGTFKLDDTSLGARALAFDDFLNSLIDSARPEIVGVEAPLIFIKAMRNPESRLIAIGLWWEALRICEKRSLRWKSLQLSQIRAYFLGRDRPKKSAAVKEAVVAACIKRGLMPPDHNAADAYAVWECLVAKTWPQDAMRFSLAGFIGDAA